jgi:hypothetical protein
MKEPEVTIQQLPKRAQAALPASWNRGTRFFFSMRGVFALRGTEMHRWSGRSWVPAPHTTLEEVVSIPGQ